MPTPRPEHAPQGNPCRLCGLARARHRKRSRARASYFQHYRQTVAADRTNETGSARPVRPIIALDGEGHSLPDGSHLYTYLAACTETELVAELYRPRGIRFQDVASFLLDELPREAMLVGFSLGYDRTKWLESLPNLAVYGLMHSELRQGRKGLLPVPVKVGEYSYLINLVSSLFTLKRSDGAKQRVWDLFKFYQSSFVVALERWGIGTEKERAKISAMKQKRGAFKSIDLKERAYCQSECMLLAKLARSLLDAHEEVGLHLRNYYGPGSSASCLLEQCNAKSQKADVPDRMICAVQSAYFGGRFESSRVGPVREKVYEYDIASAYPYALALLPCLDPEHGRWVHRRQWKGEPWAVVRYVTNASALANPAWGPLPHRLPDGNIVFPRVSAGGWAWAVELRAAFAVHPGIVPLDAWVWQSKCVCPPPFRARVLDAFDQRKAWGKSSKGIVLKLALNSMYGKSAQQVGSGRYTCMVRAGLITATTKAMLLYAVAEAQRAGDPWSILELATDSVLSTRPIKFPASPFGALGAWEVKEPWEHGAFILRPGLRFDLQPEGGITRTAARGVGVRTLHGNRERVLAGWDASPLAPVMVQCPSMFHGARSSLRRMDAKSDPTKYQIKRDAVYGKWTTPEPRILRYAPEPKRSCVLPDYRLDGWELPQGRAFASRPYSKVAASPLGDILEELRTLEDEQPDPSMSDLF